MMSNGAQAGIEKACYGMIIGGGVGPIASVAFQMIIR